MQAKEILLFLIVHSTVIAQIDDLGLSGKILDEVDGLPVIGATVQLSTDEQQIYQIGTDTSGAFVFDGLRAGRYNLQINSIGYQTKILAEVEVTSGVPRYEIIRLRPTPIDVDQVVVKAESRSRANSALTSIHTLTIEETFRFPGTFYDPARLATHFAGVVSMNDQANNIVIRGNSPNAMGWYLEGMEIVNPNHTSNAGTVNDRPTQSGGGVNILSAQMLDNTSFLKGPFPAYYGNALSGVMDMRMREGARDGLHFTGQIGLLGIDAALEGPMGQSKDASYLVNYRYSTLGLLSSMGVDLSDEVISFQDLSFHLKWPVGKAGSVSFFGMGGNSSNVFETKVPGEWEEFKDRQDIEFSSRMGALGLSLRTGQWTATLMYSGNRHERYSELYDMDGSSMRFEDDLSAENRLGLHVQRRFVTASGFVDIGTRVNRISYDVKYAYALRNESVDDQQSSWLFQPYIDSKWTLNSRLSLQAGMHSSVFSLLNTGMIEPRLALRQRLSAKNQVSLAYGLQSRLPSIQSMFYRPSLVQNTDLKLIKTHHVVLSHDYSISSVSKITSEIYYQHLYDIPISTDEQSSYSALNSIDAVGLQTLESEGTGRNVGLEVSYHHYLANATYYELNGTVFDSKYTGADGIERNTRFNGRFGLNLTAGKEYSWTKTDKIKTIGVNLRISYFGGFWTGIVDEEQSSSELRTVFREADAYTQQLPALFRADARIYYKRIKAKYTSILGLDLLNMTNQENVSYRFFDPLTDQVMNRNQLGLIPNLSYRIEF
ncbi:MAG: TonB-dependent receptor [Saprospiraceae bacterium]|nr:TonB-dependent receptor [Saprospiraceae bacterium]